MAPESTDEADLRCSFCGKDRTQVKTLIVANSEPGASVICDECVFACVQFLSEEAGAES